MSCEEDDRHDHDVLLVDQDAAEKRLLLTLLAREDR